MLKFEEVFIKGIPTNHDDCKNIPDQNSVMREWENFLDESKRFIEKTKNRKPIVDFKVRKEIIDKFNKEPL